jgi:flagellin
MLGVIENATNDVTDMLHRMRELAIQATNDTNSDEDRAFLQKEVTALIAEIDRVATDTQYNGQKVLEGGFTSKSIQVGTEAGQTITFSVNGIKANAIGTAYVEATAQQITDGAIAADGNVATLSNKTMVAKADVLDIDISNATDAQAGLQVITDAIEQVAGDRATYGALQNRLEYTVSNLMNVAEFTTAARSRIEDADFAAESARLAKAQVLQQTGTAMLAQANASSQLALSLIR